MFLLMLYEVFIYAPLYSVHKNVITRIYVLIAQIVVLSSIYILVFIPHSQLFVTYVIVSYTGLFTSFFDKANVLKFSPDIVELYYINMYP